MTYQVTANIPGTFRSTTLNLGTASFMIQQLGAAPSLIGSMPHLAAEGGWNTTFTLVNKVSASVDAQASMFDSGGNPLPLPFAQQSSPSPTTEAVVSTSLAANASASLVASGPADTPFAEGSAQLAATGIVDGFAIFHYDPSQQEAVVPLETRNSPPYLLAFDNTGGVLTGIALENVSSSSANIPLIVRNEAGTPIISSFATLPANGHTSFVLSTQYPTTASIRGAIEFKPPIGGRISVLGIRYTLPGTLTTIPALVNLANTPTTGGLMAHLASGNGWESTFVQINTNASAVQAQLNFFADDGSPLSLPLTFPQTGATAIAALVSQNIAPGASLWIQTSGPVGGALLTGSAQLTTMFPNGVNGYAVFRYNPNGQEAVVPLEIRNASSFLLAFDNTNSVSTGLAISNGSSQSITVPVVLRGNSGSQIGTGNITLAANGHFSQVLANIFAVTANIRGTLEFEVPAGAPISVLGIRSPPALMFTTLPALAK